MPQFDTITEANERYQETFSEGTLSMPPARKVAILTCMDARLHPETFLGLNVGDAHVIRNAGGRASEDAIRSLIISEQLLGTEEIVVIHHTDCGMLTFTNDDLRSKLKAEHDLDAKDIDFLPFPDLEQSVRDDVQFLRDSPYIPDAIVITGAIYDVTNGKLSRVA